MSSIDINSEEFKKEFITDLVEEAVDAWDGKILGPGQMVIRSPHNTALVVADSPDNRVRFVELGFVWDEPTRIKRVQKEVDKLAKMGRSYGDIRSTDVAYRLNMSVSVIEQIFNLLVQTQDYYLGNEAKDSHGNPCLVILKRS